MTSVNPANQFFRVTGDLQIQSPSLYNSSNALISFRGDFNTKLGQIRAFGFGGGITLLLDSSECYGGLCIRSNAAQGDAYFLSGQGDQYAFECTREGLTTIKRLDVALKATAYAQEFDGNSIFRVNKQNTILTSSLTNALADFTINSMRANEHLQILVGNNTFSGCAVYGYQMGNTTTASSNLNTSYLGMKSNNVLNTNIRMYTNGNVDINGTLKVGILDAGTVTPASVLPLTLDKVNGYVGINNAFPTDALSVIGTVSLMGQTTIETGLQIVDGFIDMSATDPGVIPEYKINGNSVLSSSELGPGVLTSSLTSVGTLTSLAVQNNINSVSGEYQINSIRALRLLASGAISMGPSSATLGSTQGTGAVAIGASAGKTSQANYAVAIGASAGETTQAANSVAIGIQSGQSTQGNNSVAIGYKCGQSTQGAACVAIGNSAGNGSQAIYAVAIGSAAGTTGQKTNAVAIGNAAGATTQGVQGVAIGFEAGKTTQADYAVALGSESGTTSQGANSVAVGKFSGYSNQGINSVAIGMYAGSATQSQYTTAIGNAAGRTSQGENSVAIGSNAGTSTQGSNSVAVGANAGSQTQAVYSVAIGLNAGYDNQGTQSVAIGTNAGRTTQKTNAVALGNNAGNNNQGDFAIAIGSNAGHTNQHANSIILNGTGASVNSDATSCFYVKPIREDSTKTHALNYDPISGEIVYKPASSTTPTIITSWLSADQTLISNTAASELPATQWNNLANITLAPGTWIVDAFVLGDGGTIKWPGICISTTNAYAHDPPNYCFAKTHPVNNAEQNDFAEEASYCVNVTVNTTLYLLGFGVQGAAGTMVWKANKCGLRATKIVSS